MPSLLKEAFDVENFRTQGHKIIDLLADYLSNIKSADYPQAIPYTEPQNNLSYWSNYQNKSSISQLFSDVIARSVHVNHPKYLGHQVGLTPPLTALSGALAALLNNSSAIYEMGMSATAIEKNIIDVLNRAVGYSSQAGGFLTSGGTLGNLTAILNAKNTILQKDKEQKWSLFVSEEAHYCIERAGMVLGLKQENIVKIPSDENYCLSIDALKNIYQQKKVQGIEKGIVVGSACTTSSGSYDDLSAMALFCKKENLWFHVDGAHGVAVAFSEKHKNKIRGIEHADSVVIDCHKMLLYPTLCTAVIFKNEENSFNAFNQNADYLWSKSKETLWCDLSLRTYECTKNMMGLHFFMLMKLYGEKLFEENVDTLFELATLFGYKVKENSYFELACEPQANILCFRYVNEKVNKEDISRLNLKIRQSLLEDGEFYIVQTKLKSQVYLRMTILNPFSTVDVFTTLLSKIETIAHRIITASDFG